MTVVALLDTGPLGLITHPRGGQEAKDCKVWLERFLEDGGRAFVSAIADYELGRELLRTGSSSVRNLNNLIRSIGYLRIDRDVFEIAARLWAAVRRSGKPTVPDLALDGDCILGAQTRTVYRSLTREQIVKGFEVVIATTNPRHLSRFAKAEHWRAISTI
jgi:predicted nucleic acid-binding protein